MGSRQTSRRCGELSGLAGIPVCFAEQITTQLLLRVSMRRLARSARHRHPTNHDSANEEKMLRTRHCATRYSLPLNDYELLAVAG